MFIIIIEKDSDESKAITRFRTREEAQEFAESNSIENYRIIEGINPLDYFIPQYFDDFEYSKILEFKKSTLTVIDKFDKLYKLELEKMNLIKQRIENILKFREDNPKESLDVDKISQLIQFNKIHSRLTNSEISTIGQMLKEFRQNVLQNSNMIYRSYLGMKTYDAFTGQVSWYEYGMGPKHGSIVYRIQIKRDNEELLEELKSSESLRLQLAKYIQIHIDNFDLIPRESR